MGPWLSYNSPRYSSGASRKGLIEPHFPFRVQVLGSGPPLHRSSSGVGKNTNFLVRETERHLFGGTLTTAQSRKKDVETEDQATPKGHSSEPLMMSTQLSVTYWVICLDLRNPILQRPLVTLPGQWFIFLQNICFTFLLSVNVHSWLLA